MGKSPGGLGFTAVRLLPAIIMAVLLAPDTVLAVEVQGIQTGTWTLAASPYVVSGDVLVPAGETLTIEPGAIVQFGDDLKLKIEGTLNVTGLLTNQVIFTSTRDLEFGGTLPPGATPVTPGAWVGIEFGQSGTSSRVEHCIIRYASMPLRSRGASPVLVSITISEAGTSAVDLNGTLVPILPGIQQDFTVGPVQKQVDEPAAGLRFASIDGMEEDTPDVGEGSSAFDFGEVDLGSSAFEVHGYFDTEFEVDNKNADGKIGDFDVHHFNVITTFDFSERALVLGEVEYEHGPEHSGSTTAGLVALERGWLQIAIGDNFHLRVGKFLTPYGIYNRTHDASPTFISTKLPFSLYDKHPNASGGVERDYPKFMGGLSLNGIIAMSGGDFEYFVYAGNGKGAEPYEQDDNANKAVGFRGRFIDGRERFKLGASFYRGRNGNDAHTLQQLLAADLEATLGSLTLQAEGSFNQFDRFDAVGAVQELDRSAFAWYVQGILSLRERLHPFVRYDTYDMDIDSADDAASDISVGVNISVLRDVFLKLESHFRRHQSPTIDAYELFIASIAAGF